MADSDYREVQVSVSQQRRCATFDLPPAGSRDRERVDRFKAWLEIVGDAPQDENGRHVLPAAAYRYAMGEDVDPRAAS